MQPLNVLDQNDDRKARRAQHASTPRELEVLAAGLRTGGATWKAIAEELGYANGAVARRAALRSASRIQSDLEPAI